MTVNRECEKFEKKMDDFDHLGFEPCFLPLLKKINKYENK